jgi:hypothetical protein
MGNKKALFVTSWIVSLDLKDTEASFLPSSIESLRLRVTQVPRCRDMVIFVRTTDDRQQTNKPIALPLAAHAHTQSKKAQQPKTNAGGPEKLIFFSWPYGDCTIEVHVKIKN